MTEGAARLVDAVFPRQPVRMWVLSMPCRVRWHLARKPKLKREALAIFIRELTALLRRLASSPRGKIGAVTVVQRSGSALNLNVHFHTLAVDGLYEGAEFHPAATPTQEDLDKLAARLRVRIMALLVRRSCFPDPDEGETADPHEEEPPTLFEILQAASIRGWVGMSAEAVRVETIGTGESDEWKYVQGPLCAESKGFNVQAAVRIPETDREALEQLCRYVLRPPYAADRFTQLEDGRIAYELRRPMRSGTRALVLRPLELMEKLAALVPPPKAHQTHYHGILAPHAKSRRQVVPEPGPERACCGGGKAKQKPCPTAPTVRPDFSGRAGAGRRASADWATMLRRTFAVDALKCPSCGGRMKLIATIEDPEVIRKILRSMGLASEPPIIAAARAPPAEQLPWEESA